MIRTSISAIGKATADRSPSYYLISKSDNKKTQPGKAEEKYDMTYYKNLLDIPSYYQNAIKKLVNSGVMTGTGNGELNVSEDLCRQMTILDNLGILDLTAPTVYKTIDDVPSYYRAAVQKMIDRGAISGTGNGELNIGADICRSLTILDKAGLIDISDDMAELLDGEIKGKHFGE